MVGNSYKKTIPAGMSDVVGDELPMPAWVKGPLTLTASLRYRQFNCRYPQWALDSPSNSLPITDLARDALVLPVRLRPPVQR